MRVIAGTARSLPLKTPEGMDTRPTTDRIKETLFNMLQTEITDSIFVDLFSGSGGIGIEALSRGAEHAYFIENGKKAAACIRQNLEFTKFTDRATLLMQDVAGAISLIREEAVDIIYMDPPYQEGYEERVLQLLAEQAYVTVHTLIVVEAVLAKDFSFVKELGYRIVKEKNYKTNKHIFLKRQEE
ncbi:MAG: 16S rRNA (guanine(966)-N(2))-methyltransferase RsmD [Lachnospiraceae bacterium]|nr:16S rRNA (guanine(966)-N(2))-methyltransferase RsmD [Lachnospiraceae bacterium]